MKNTDSTRVNSELREVMKMDAGRSIFPVDTTASSFSELNKVLVALNMPAFQRSSGP
jgi:hypothetical protein